MASTLRLTVNNGGLQIVPSGSNEICKPQSSLMQQFSLKTAIWSSLDTINFIQNTRVCTNHNQVLGKNAHKSGKTITVVGKPTDMSGKTTFILGKTVAVFAKNIHVFGKNSHYSDSFYLIN